MTQDLILRVKNNGITTDLDIDNNIPLRLDMSAVENQEIGEVFGIASQNFSLPGTKKNNQFFSYAYEIGATDIPAFYNTIECYVLSNGETLIQGQLQLKEVVTDNSGFTTYDVLVTNSIVQFNEAIKDKFLYEGNWDPYNHILNTDNVFKSWNARSGSDNSFIINGTSGSIFYPYIDYGFDSVFQWPEYPIITADTLFGPGSFLTGSTTNPFTPLNLAQLYPAVGAREVIDVIFQQAGFTYTSSFIDSEDFDELFVLSKNKEGLGPVGPAGDSINNFSASLDPSQTIPIIAAGDDQEFALGFSGSVFDPGSNYDPATFYYTAPIAGEYTFGSTVNFTNGAGGSTQDEATDYNLIFYVDRVGTPTDQQSTLDTLSLVIGDVNDPYTLSGQATTFMAPGDRAAIFFEVNNRSSAVFDTIPTFVTDSIFEVTSAPIDYQDFPVTMSLQIDNSIKTIDMFKSFLTQFNLVAYPDQSQEKVIQIETFDTWMRSGEIKDWTNKYETAKRISISNPVIEEPRELIFQNEEDSDRISKNTKESTPNFQYGTLRALSESNLTSGKTTVSGLFAPTVLAPAVSLTTASLNPGVFPLAYNQLKPDFIIPHLYKFDNSQQKSYKFKPRIGYRTYYNDSGMINFGGNFNIPNTNPFELIPSGTLLVTQGQKIQSGSQYTEFQFYSTLSNYDTYPVSSSTKNLLFNSSYDNISKSNIRYISEPPSNFDTYWKTYIDSIYDEDGRKVTIDLYFTPQEYKSIELNDRIQIKNQVYRINKIKGFNLSEKDIVTVELLKLFPAYWQQDNIPLPSPSPTPTPSPTITPTPTLTPTPTPTPSISPLTEDCYIIEDCTTQAVYYVSITEGCVNGVQVVLSSTFVPGEILQYHIGTNCPGGATLCAEVTGTIFTIPTAQITENLKPVDCNDVTLCIE